MSALADQPVKSTHLSLEALPRAARFAQWQQWMGDMVDIAPLSRSTPDDFSGSLSLHAVGDVILSHCQSDGLRIHRGLDRISRQRATHAVFHITPDGGHGRASFNGHALWTHPGDVLMLDFDQALTVERNAYHAVGLFVPRSMLPAHLELFRQPLRVASHQHAYTRLVGDWARTLVHHLPALTADEANQAIANFIPVVARCFSGEHDTIGLTSQASSLCRRVAAYISTNREDPELSVSGVARHFGLSRPQLYRLFANENEGPAALIRRYRLQAAAHDLTHRPDLSIADIGYAAGFSTASRRECGLSPQQLRQARVGGQGVRQAPLARRPYANLLDALTS